MGKGEGRDLLVEGEGVGNSDGEGDGVAEQGARLPSQLEHLLRRKHAALGIEAVVVSNLHHASAGLHIGHPPTNTHTPPSVRLLASLPLGSGGGTVGPVGQIRRVGSWTSQPHCSTPINLSPKP